MTTLPTLIALAIAPLLAQTPTPTPPAIPADHPHAALLDQVSTARLMQTLTDIPPSRSPRGGEANQRALVDTERWITEQLEALGYEATVLPIESATGPTFEDAPPAWTNILIEIPGQPDPARTTPPETLILSAHYDSVQGSPGADDDGTGVAALLEIARILRDHRPERTIRLIFFNLEETGLLGSRDYCSTTLREAINADEEAVIGMVSLEMLGYFSDEPNSQGSPLPVLPGGEPAPTVGDFIAMVGLAAHRDFSGPWADAMLAGAPGLKVQRADVFPLPIPDILRSDHAPFLLLGIPAIMLTDTANFRNPNYHRASDSIATIDAERFTLVTRGVLAAILEFAGEAEAPAGDDEQADPAPPPATQADR